MKEYIEENIAAQLPGVLSKAIAKSSRLMAEDLCREAGFMLSQSTNTREISLRFFLNFQLKK